MSYGAGPKALVAVVSSALVAAAVGVGFVATHRDEPVPVVNAWEETAPAGTDDGLVRFEVTVDRSAFAPRAAAAEPSPTASVPPGDDGSALDATAGTGVDEAALSAAAAGMLAAGGRPQLRFLDGGAWVVDANGALPRIRVPFDGTVSATPTAPAPAPAPAAPVSDTTIVTALAREPGVSWAAPMGGNRFLVVADPGTDPEGIDGVTDAAKSAAVQVAGGSLPGEPDLARQWWAPQTQVADAFARTHGEQVVVAVVDTVMDPTRMDAQVWQNTDEVCGNGTDDDANGYVDDCAGWNFYTNTPDVGAPRSGGVTAADHGTAVSAAVAAAINGIEGFGMAPNVAIMPVPFGTASTLTLAGGIAAITYAVNNGADIINCSWGGQYPMPDSLDAALAYAQSKGVLVVISAGNSSTDAGGFSPASSTRPNVLTVGSTGYAIGVSETYGADVFVTDAMSSFSNFSPTAVDLFAPGAGIWLPSLSKGHYTWMHGTSFSAPLTAGAAALVKSLQPSLSGTTLRSMLMASVDAVPGLSGRSITGGRLNVAKAVDLVPEIRTEYRSMRAPDPATPSDPYDVTATVHLSGAAPSDVASSTALGLTVGLVRRGLTPTGLDGTDVLLATRPLTIATGTVSTDIGLTAGDLAAAADGVDLPLAVALPAGEYALVTQVVDDAGLPVTNPVGARFYVGPAATTSSPSGSPSVSLSASPTAVSPTATTTAPVTLTPIPVVPPAPTSGAPAPTGTATATSPATPTARLTVTPSPTTSATTSATPTTSGTGAAPTSGNAQPPTTSSTPTAAPSTSTRPTTAAPTTSAPTTAAPTTPAPTSATPTTASPTTTSSSPTAAPTTTVPSTRHFGIDRLSPSAGTIDGNTLVTMYATDLPLSGYVRVNGTLADVLAWGDPTQLSFFTPPGVATGPVDVVLCSHAAVCDTINGGFVYTASLVSPTASPPSAAPTTAAPTTSTSATASATLTAAPTAAPTGAPSTSASSSTPGSPAPSTSTSTSTSARPTYVTATAAPTPTGSTGTPTSSTSGTSGATATATATPRARLRSVSSVLTSATLFTSLPSPCTGGTCSTAVL